MKLKYAGKDIFKFPVQAPPEVRFEPTELVKEIEQLMQRYGLTDLEVHV